MQLAVSRRRGLSHAMKSRLNLVAVGVFALALIAALLIFAAIRSNVRAHAGRLSSALISPFLKSGSEVDRKVTAFREGMKTLNQLEAEVKQLRIANRELSADEPDPARPRGGK